MSDTPTAQPPRDPGRQPERTRLSWRRTVLTVTAVALLAGRLGLTRSPTVAALTIGAAVVGWLAVLLLAGRRISAMAAAEPPAARWAMPLTALAAAGYAGIGVALVAAH
jgi:hypothetical protein